MLARQRETLIGAVTAVTVPLVFLALLVACAAFAIRAVSAYQRSI